jgi:hypothetical protein
MIKKINEMSARSKFTPKQNTFIFLISLVQKSTLILVVVSYSLSTGGETSFLLDDDMEIPDFMSIKSELVSDLDTAETGWWFFIFSGAVGIVAACGAAIAMSQGGGSGPKGFGIHRGGPSHHPGRGGRVHEGC